MIAPQCVRISTVRCMRPESQKPLRHIAHPAWIWPSATECALQENRPQGRVAPAGRGTGFDKTGYETVADQHCRLQHDPEKWDPVFGKRSCPSKWLDRDDDSKKRHPELATGCE